MSIREPVSVFLTPLDSENLLYALDGALRIRSRGQFQRWVQGSLQVVLPHEIFVGARGEILAGRYRYDCFSATPPAPRFAAALADPIDGLMMRLIDLWQGNGRQPLACTVSDTGPLPARLRVMLARCGIVRFVLHGMLTDGEGSMFAFFNGPPASDERETYFLELLLPQLHVAAQSFDHTDGVDEPSDEIRLDEVLSERELQVLQWVREGKTNQEIAQILVISPLTVKNHVQKILRKLKVTNRAQAVARAAAARVFTD